MNCTEYLLSVLAEECAEVAQRASKAQRFGMDEIQPGHLLNNRDRIIGELNDLWAAVEMLDMAAVSREAIEAKKRKVLQFMEYSEKCGTLTRIDDAQIERIWPTPSSSDIGEKRGG